MFSFLKKRRNVAHREADLISGSAGAGQGPTDPLTATRMTDHNVRGRASDEDQTAGVASTSGFEPSGLVTEYEAIRISSYDLPGDEEKKAS